MQRPYKPDPTDADPIGVLAAFSGAERRPFPIADSSLATPGEGDDPQDGSEAGEDARAPTYPSSVEGLLNERQSTHGEFRDNARVSQALKEIFRASPGWAHLDDVEREAMDMIALKFSRVLSGKSLEKQHWEDVVGYGKLAEKECL